MHCFECGSNFGHASSCSRNFSTPIVPFQPKPFNTFVAPRPLPMPQPMFKPLHMPKTDYLMMPTPPGFIKF
jgi:hypothetical protein